VRIPGNEGKIPEKNVKKISWKKSFGCGNIQIIKKLAQ